MITVELRQIPEGEREHRAVAALTVADDGTYHLEDPAGVFPTQLHVVVPDGAGAWPRAT